jgi:hypothetical protein
LWKGKFFAPWIEKVNTVGSPCRIAAVPFPWWTSVSMTTTRSTRPAAWTARAAMVESLKTQYPSPLSENAWCVPPARLAAKPSSRAARHAPSVPPEARRERSTIFSDHGKPMRRISFSVSVPETTCSR